VNLVLKRYKEALLTELQAQKHSTTQLHSLLQRSGLYLSFLSWGRRTNLLPVAWSDKSCSSVFAQLAHLPPHLFSPLSLSLSLFVPKQFKTKSCCFQVAAWKRLLLSLFFLSTPVCEFLNTKQQHHAAAAAAADLQTLILFSSVLNSKP
jgi:hypothetical protein